MTTLDQEHKDIARRAIEEVCARGDFEKAKRYYSPHFRDRVNDLEYRGLEGVRQSVTMYRSVFPDLEIEVVDQVVEGDRVVSRWTARGTNRGRRASLDGITISHIEDGKIVEDWGVSDNLSLLRQLGLWRVAALGLAQLRDRLAKRASSV
jgi:predicted ester cyclase